MTSGEIYATFCKFNLAKNGYRLRLATANDAESYFEHNYQPLDPIVVKQTGCKAEFTREEVTSFFLENIGAEDRIWLLLIHPNGNIVGEAVIMDIDWQLKSGHFRLCLFHAQDRGKGLGRWLVESCRDVAFSQLGLHRLELEVYSFNTQAQKLYEQAGFKQEGILRDAVFSEGRYADIVLMAMLEEEWKALSKQ